MKINKYVLTDTCFWYGLYDEDDDYHQESTEIYELIKNMNVIIPWPIYYEVLGTRFVRRENQVNRFKNDIRKLEAVCIDDAQYRDNALIDLLSCSIRNVRYELYSLVDCVVNEIIKDMSIRIDYMITFNDKDFYLACERRGIEIIKNV
jgi:hypothetical protein